MILGELYLRYNSQFHSRKSHDSRNSIRPESQSKLYSVYQTSRRGVSSKAHRVVSCGIPYLGSLPLTDDKETEYTYVLRQRLEVLFSIPTEGTVSVLKDSGSLSVLGILFICLTLQTLLLEFILAYG